MNVFQPKRLSALGALALGAAACASSGEFDNVASASTCRPPAAVSDRQAEMVGFVQQRLCELGQYRAAPSGRMDHETEIGLNRVLTDLVKIAPQTGATIQSQFVNERTMAAVETYRVCVGAAAPPAPPQDQEASACAQRRYPEFLASFSDGRVRTAPATVQSASFDSTAPRAVSKPRPSAREPSPATATAPASSEAPAGQPTTTAATAALTGPIIPPRPSAAGQSVLALETIECLAGEEVWMTYYQGETRGLDGDLVQVRLDRRFGLWYDYNGKGIDDRDWFCPPEMGICYSQIAWDGWGGARRAGEVVTVPVERVIAGADAKRTHASLGDYGALSRCPRD